MKNVKKIVSMLMVIMVVAVFFTGCQKNETPVSKEENEAGRGKDVQDVDNSHEEDVQLSDWDGTWNNMGAYLDDEELQDAFKELAEEENTTAEEAKKNYLEKRKSDFDGMVIEDNKVIFLDGFKDQGGKEIGKVEYEYKESHTVKHGNFDIEWHVFETQEDAEYKDMEMMQKNY